MSLCLSVSLSLYISVSVSVSVSLSLSLSPSLPLSLPPCLSPSPACLPPSPPACLPPLPPLSLSIFLARAGVCVCVCVSPSLSLWHISLFDSHSSPPPSQMHLNTNFYFLGSRSSQNRVTDFGLIFFWGLTLLGATQKRDLRGHPS